MATSVLVAYATKYGSTQQVAEQIGETLRERGFQVDLQPMHKVTGLEQYNAVVIGTPLYMFHWLKETRTFLTQHHKALASRPVAIFAVGPVHNETKEFDDARDVLDKEIANYHWFAPIAIKVFGGKLEPEYFRFPENIIPGMRSMPDSDIRNWAAIRAWADELATEFQAAMSSVHQAI